uniref:RAB6-interacting golgin n=1 Tax=Loa loa TaxID=7209 RepID=A0A1I7VDG9_LOALO
MSELILVYPNIKLLALGKRKTGIDSRVPNGSLLSLRTFYAFGARSGRTPLLQRSLSHNPHGNSLCTKALQQPMEKNITIQRSSTASSIHSPKRTETSKPLENSAEMIALLEKNKSLEAEVKRLTLKLREKERSEREFKRKILEYAAEIKVWKKKYEMQKLTATIEISEPKGNEKEISDIMEQLNNAAEKLTRLDAVKDLKLLQSEMETALKEISK